MDILSTITELTDERLAEYADEVRAAFDTLAALEAPTVAQLDEAEAYADHLDKIAAEQTSRVEAAAQLAARREALQSRFHVEEETPAEETPAEVVEEEETTEPEAAAVVPVAAATVATIATRVARPTTPRTSQRPVTITAAADVPEFATGSALDDMSSVGQALVNRMRGFGTPSGDGTRESLQHYGVASFRLDFPPELTIDRHSDDMEILAYATREARLPGNSLTAAGGWCAPSEQLYDLCAGETSEGILSIPEINIARGGLKYTKGPDFSDIYTNTGFCQTEAEAIAGTEKPCYEVPCPTFTEVRLDACGLCIKAPILTNAAYPELIQRWLSGSMIAHQHQINAKVIARMVALAGAARVITGLGSTTFDTLEALELLANEKRQKRRMSFTETLEVIVPFWAKGMYRADIGRRTNRPASAVTDAEISSYFTNEHIAIQYVYDWQPIDETAEVYPATYQVLMYPAGTYVKGTSSIINLNAVYDAASLATNIYTALFFEEGILVANMCYEADLITLPICNAGRTGAADFTCA